MLESGESNQGNKMDIELSEIFLDSKGRVDYTKLEKSAVILPQSATLKQFKNSIFANHMTTKKDANTAIITTPIGDIKVNVLRAFNHYKKNGKWSNGKEDRTHMNATFMPTLLKPKFVTKEADTYYFYKPFKDKNKHYHIASIAVKKGGDIEYTTSYEAIDKRMINMIKSHSLEFLDNLL